ncbi:MAG: hypothetical protein ABIY35_08190 [Chitinophagaceae bacterium]
MKFSIKKKHTKIIIGVIAFIAIVLVGGNYWVRHNIESIIQNLVASESGGKYRLEIAKIKYHSHQQKLEAFNAHLYVMDSSLQESRTDVKLPYLEFQLKNIWDVIFRKKLVLDSVICIAPTFNIRPYEKDSLNKISLPEQLGALYLQIEDVMNNMQVKKLRFTKSNFNLYTPGDSTKVIRLQNIDFGVDGFGVNVHSNNTSQFFFSENIFVRSGPQAFIFPDGLHGLSFSSMAISTDKKLISINNCTLTGASPDNVSAKYNIHFDTLKLINTDFNALYRKSLIKVDTVYCQNSDINFLFNTHKKNKKVSADTMINAVLKGLFGDIQVKYIGIINSDISVKTQRDNKTLTFFSKGNNFRLREINIAAQNDDPVQVKSIDFDVKNYRSYTDDSLYEMTFDSVSLTNRELKLVNFGLLPGARNNDHALRAINIPSLTLKGLSLGDLIFDKTIKMQEAILEKPAIIIESKGNNENKIRKPLFEIFDDIEKYFSVEKLTIQNGEVQYRFSTGANHTLNFEDVNASVFLKNLFSATRVSTLETSIDRLSFSKAVYNNGLQQILLLKGVLDGNQKNFLIAQLDYIDKNELLHLNAGGLLLSGININDSADEEKINLEGLSWTGGKIISQRMPGNVNPQKTILPVSIYVNNISLPNTDLLINLPGSIQLQTFLNHLDIEQFRKPDDAAIHFNKAFFDGGSLMMLSDGLAVFTDSFNINNLNTSSIENISLRYVSSKDSVLIKIPLLSGNPDLTNFSNIKSWNGFNLMKPDIHWFLQKDSTKSFTKNIAYRTPFVLENTSVDSATLHIESYNISDTLHADVPRISFQLNYASLNDTAILRGLNVSLNGMNIYATNGTSVAAPNANLTFQIDSMNFLPRNIFNIQSSLLHLSSPGIFISGKKETRLEQVEMDIPKIAFTEKNIDDWQNVLINHTDTKLKFNTRLNNHFGKFLLNGIQFSAKDSLLQLDSLAFIPHFSSDSFFANQTWQIDYQQFHTGKIIADKVDAAALLAKNFFINARKVIINDAFIHIIKDKKLPFQHHIIKPLPVRALSKIDFPLLIDTLNLMNGNVHYVELPGNKKPGLDLNIGDLNAAIINISNGSNVSHDSLYISGTGKINNAVDAQIFMNQSYNDTAGSFQFGIHISPFDAIAINPLQQNLTKILFTKGKIDTIQINAHGDNEIAHGNVRILTKGLAIAAYHSSENIKTPLITRIKYFIANTFILKKEKTRTAEFETNRIMEKSVFNYWIRIMLSAMKSVAGIKSK